MSMLATAIKARLPLIRVTTSDPVNVAKVLAYYADTEVHRFTPRPQNRLKMALTEGAVYYVTSDFELQDGALYREFVDLGSTLILVNPDAENFPSAFDCGELRLPYTLIREFVAEHGPDDEQDTLCAALRGLSYREMVEVSALAMASSGEFTAEAVHALRRRRLQLVAGLHGVSTTQDFYAPSADLMKWLAVDGKLFVRGVDRRLRPRGLVFDGPPGTGKTSGAKYLAQQLGVPLYRFDVGATMQKYVGESERAFQAALRQVADLAPCVLLLDEVEKLFDTGTDDSGVSRRALGTLLWWLQEHDEPVLTIMTTNAIQSLPPELIRAGRIDDVITFNPYKSKENVEAFTRALVKSLADIVALDGDLVSAKVQTRLALDGRMTPAEICATVQRLAKERLVKAKEKGK